MNMNELNYESPEVEVVEVAVEQGFAATGADEQIQLPDIDDPEEGGF
ncbi:MAG: hypothetical protein IKO71_05240 [Bacteroidaceae bacterium]|nr:hypothetical protein [Bacteroidaceae bacterium]